MCTYDMPQLLHKQIYILRPTAGAKMEAAEKKKKKKDRRDKHCMAKQTSTFTGTFIIHTAWSKLHLKAMHYFSGICESKQRTIKTNPHTHTYAHSDGGVTTNSFHAQTLNLSPAHVIVWQNCNSIHIKWAILPVIISPAFFFPTMQINNP